MTTLEPSPSFVAAAAEAVRGRTGLIFTDARRGAFEAGLLRAVKRAGSADQQAYLAGLGTDDDLLDDLVSEITIGETYFFRDPQQFEVIRHQLFADLLTRRPSPQPIRVWSAGCASGEEPYTLAILAHELGVGDRVHIVGTDLCRTALRRARVAQYTPWSLRGVPPATVERYFERLGAGGTRTPLPAIRQAVEFDYLNLASDVYPSLRSGIWGMDLVLCRNVLIYLDGATIARVAHRLLGCLAEDGWLVLGAADPPLADYAPCEVEITSAGLAYRRPSHRTRHRWLPPAPLSPRPVTGAIPAPVAAPPAPEPPELPASPPAPALPADTDVDLGEALQAYARMEYDRAGHLAAQLAARPGAATEVWALLVRAAGNRGDLEAAGRACAAGLERHPTSAELVYLHGLLLAQGGHVREAAGALRRALYLDRALAVAHLTLGRVLTQLGDGEGGRRALRNAHRVLSRAPADAPVPAADGERAGRLAEMARVQLALLDQPGWVRPQP
jgi:chemotaxis protein methyltransferase CheR